MLISIALSGCVEEDGGDEEEEYTCKYNYEVIINGSNHYFNILVPVPVYIDDNEIIYYSKINDELRNFYGNSSFNLEIGIFNHSLRISGWGNSTIGISGNDLSKYFENNEYLGLFLSMGLDKDNDGYYDDEYGKMNYRIYCYQNITLSIDIKLKYQHHNGIFLKSEALIQGEIQQGWNIVNGTFHTVVS
jgi:hypothetical protein